MTIGFRVNTSVTRPGASLVDRLSSIPSTDLSDAMRCSGTMEHRLKPMFDGMPRIAGPAITVSLPTISMSVLKAGFDQARPGDVIVVNAMGASSSAVVGGNMLRGLHEKGIAGIIIDGSIRDVSEAREEGFPVFAAGTTTATGPEGPDAGEVNVPIACGRIVVNPGDIVVADEDGIVVVPTAIAEDLLAIVSEKQARMAERQAQARADQAERARDLVEKLKEAGCTVS